MEKVSINNVCKEDLFSAIHRLVSNITRTSGRWPGKDVCQFRAMPWNRRFFSQSESWIKFLPDFGTKQSEIWNQVRLRIQEGSCFVLFCFSSCHLVRAYHRPCVCRSSPWRISGKNTRPPWGQSIFDRAATRTRVRSNLACSIFIQH